MSHLFARTNNLYEFPYTSNLGLSGSGNNRTVIEKTYNGSSVIKLQPNTAYYMSGDRSTSQDVNCVIALFTSYPKIGSISKHFYYYNSTSQSGVEFTTESDETYGLIEHRSSLDYTTDYHMMLNVGTTALPYEPYRIERSLDHVYVKARTENLAPPMDIWLNGYVNTSGQISAQSATRLEKTSPLIQVDDSLTYVYSYGSNSGYFPEGDENVAWRAIACYDTDGVFLTRIGGNGRHPIITTGVNALPTGTAFIRLTLRTYGNNTNCMLNTGSTAKPYEPYLITKEAWEARTRVILHNLTNPLCGIGTYKDTLDLSTGTLTRYIRKLVLTGDEIGWSEESSGSNRFFQIALSNPGITANGVCTHFVYKTISVSNTDTGFSIIGAGTNLRIRPDSVSSISISDFKQWIADQYAAGTPVVIWYVLATPETETITVPSNLTGVVEGYLTQSSTPSPTFPVYPTANGTPEQGGTYSLDTGAYAIAWGRADTFTGTNSISARCYGLPIKSWEIDGNSQQDGTSTPDNPIYPEFVGERTGNLFDNALSARVRFVVDSRKLREDAYTKSLIMPCEPETEYTLSKMLSNRFIVWGLRSYPVEGGTDYTELARGNDQTSLTFTTGSSDIYLLVMVSYNSSTPSISDIANSVMLNLGSTPLPYEPYGWAIEIEVT